MSSSSESLAFTGERYIPEWGWPSIAYEHLSRYLLAQELCDGKQVLDLGSGAGYGTHLLAGRAAFAVGIDISREALHYATRRYAPHAANLRFIQGNAIRLPFEARSIDLVVAFEVLEHVHEHEELLAEVRRVLRPGGMLLISTPNKAVYSDAAHYSNPFHARELYYEEFRALVETHFPAVRYFVQKNLAGSLISSFDESEAHAMRVRRICRNGNGNEYEPAAREASDSMYFIAACADSAAPLSAISGVVLADRDMRLPGEPGARWGRSPVNAGQEAIVRDAVESATRLAHELASRRQRALDETGAPAEENTYDLIIPSFNAPDALAECLDSLIANTDARHLIHVIDDASTDPRIDGMLKRYAAKHRHIRYYRLPVNVGFPGAVNAGLASTRHDVVIINSDTSFPPGWLARMDRCRRSDPGIHAVSPLSNNATICSVPRINEANALPRGMSVPDMDRLVQQTSLRLYPRVPTVVGFCMLVTRRAIDDVGPFDMAFGRGYGEEVDWCQRARAMGYESAICDDVYVFHHGGVTFSGVADRQALKDANDRRISQRWPGYGHAVLRYCSENPLRFQQHRLLERLRCHSSAGLGVLHVIHGYGNTAGTEIFTRHLVEGMREIVASTVVFPARLPAFMDGDANEEGGGLLKGGVLKVRMNANLDAAEHIFRGVDLSLRSARTEGFFADVLAASGARIVQFDHLGNLGSLALPLIAGAMGVKVVIVLHDYFLLCPDWNLLHADGMACGEPRADPDKPRCVDCVARRIRSRVPAPLDVPTLLEERNALCRAIVERADAIVAPSLFVRDQFVRAWGATLGERVRVIPHGTTTYAFRASHVPAEDLRVAFVGYATLEKGVATFVKAARRLRELPIRFRIIGALDHGITVDESDNVEVTGNYPPRELPRLLQDVDVAFLGSIAHETYCFTLDESFRAGVPVIASAVGAIPERVADGVTGMLIPPGDDSALASVLTRLEGDRALVAAMRDNVAKLTLRSLKETVSEYLDLYESLAAERTPPLAHPDITAALEQGAAQPEVSFQQFQREKGIDIRLPLTPVGVEAQAKRR